MSFSASSFEGILPGYCGIPEPEGDPALLAGDSRVLMLMPGLAYGRDHNRIGYGGGYYDKYLSDKDALQLRSIGIGYKCQLVENVPADETDIKPYQVICV